LTTRIFKSGSAFRNRSVHGGQRFQRRDVAGAGHHDVGLGTGRFRARPWPDADAGIAMRRGLAHAEPLRCRLLAGDDHVDAVVGAQAMIGDPQQRVGIGRKVDADDVGLLVGDEIDEAGVLVAEAVMVLAPDMRGQEIVERGDRAAPRQRARYLQPFGVLVEHGIDDVDEGFIAGEEPVPAGEQVAFEPALAKMFAQDFHHPSVLGEMDVVRFDPFDPDPLGRLEHRIEPVRGGLVRSHDAEISRLGVELDDIAQEFSELARGLGLHVAGRADFDGVAAIIRQFQFALQQPAIGARIGAHAPLAFRRQRLQFGNQPAVPIE
jgi:hypothetical protein